MGAWGYRSHLGPLSILRPHSPTSMRHSLGAPFTHGGKLWVEDGRRRQEIDKGPLGSLAPSWGSCLACVGAMGLPWLHLFVKTLYEVFSKLYPHCVDFLMRGHLLLDLLEPSLSSCSCGTPHSLWLGVEVVWVARPALVWCVCSIAQVRPLFWCQARQSHAPLLHRQMENRSFLCMVLTSCLAAVSPSFALPSFPHPVEGRSASPPQKQSPSQGKV